MLKKTLLATVVTSLFAFNASAADEGHGVVNFTGTVISSPCSVIPGDDKIDVDLGQVADDVLNSTNDATSAEFKIHLQDCILTAGGTTIDKVKVTFTSANVDSTDSSLMTNTASSNSATGVGVRILDASDKKISLNSATTVTFPNTDANQELTFRARMEKITGGTVAPGNVYAQANYVLSYN
ncbi:Fimbrial protein domain-containing protein [Enterobacter soli]|uniref:fimbrial-like protein n=1 Tax=Enterobacter soli TaxID=885040 RepID=UPI000223C50D|nr:fimbrial-like protein [Enterobacter soli]AEN62960.1 Fimbrial protein domain-containing protein [Enterobacter soli]OAT41448.1 YgiL family fimbrial-like protein [Enterobacter soli ATCC BAA-2102]